MSRLSQLSVSLFASVICACSSAPTPRPATPVAEAPAQTAPIEVAPSTPEPVMPSTPANPPVVVATPTLGGAINDFGFRLYQQARADLAGNASIAPASVWMALAMTQEGARAQTLTDMRRVLAMPEGEAAHSLDDATTQALHSWNGDHPAYTLRVVNRLFGERSLTFHEPFMQITQSRFGAPLERVDFVNAPDATRQHINQWVSQQTERRINDLIPPGVVDSSTSLVLTNAVYFLGKWQSAFQVQATRPVPFHVDASHTVQVPTMWQTQNFRLAVVDDAEVLAMPYQGDDFEMLIVLPNEGVELASIESRLDAATFDRYVSTLEPQRVEVLLPRFTIDGGESLALRPALAAMGMGVAFGPGADFAGISPTATHISSVLHKTFVKVDESGTEAAAATAVVMTRSAAVHAPTHVFRADRPFLFMIRDVNNGAVFFIGRVTQPRD